MKINPFRKRRTIPKPLRAQKEYKNPFFSKENFSDILFRTLKIHYGLIILIVFGLGYLFFFSEIFQFNFIEVTGATKISNEDIKTFVTEEINVSRFVFFKQKNYFMIDGNKVEKEVKNKIQETIGLEEFSLKKKFPRTIKVYLKEIIPSVTWYNGRRYYYIDKGGLVAKSVVEEEVDHNYPLIEDVNGFLITPPEQVISADIVSVLQEITNKLNNIGVDVSGFQTAEIECLEEVIIKEDKELESDENENVNSNENKNIDSSNKNVNTAIPECNKKELLLKSSRLNVKTNQEYLIYLDISQDIENQISSLDLILKTTLKGKTEGLEYIDLRFENKVYYK